MSFQQAPIPPAPYEGQIKKSNGLAVAGFVLALLGVLMSFIPIINLFGDVLAALGLIFGVVGLVKSGSAGAGKGLSIAAIILAVAGVIISIVINLVVVAVVDGTAKAINNVTVAAPVTGKLGQPVKDGDFTFVVKAVTCGMMSSGGPNPSEPKGQFCSVELTVANHGKSAQAFDSSLVEGFVGGSRYMADPDMKADPASSALLKDISPGDLISTVVLIDVPIGKVLDQVELHDSFASEGTSVSVR